MTFIERVGENPQEYIVSCVAGAAGAKLFLPVLDDGLKTLDLGFITDHPSYKVLDLLCGCFAGVMAYDG